MPKWKISVLLFTAVAMAVGQSAADLDSPAVLNVAKKLRCSCGCNQDLGCKMEGDCQVCRRGKEKIFSAQQAGKTDQQVIDQFVAETGKDALVVHPGLMGIVGPYAALGVGLAFVILFIRRFRRPQLAGSAADTTANLDPAVLERIEKDLSKFD
ncbi:MAG: cytochrome c-type biogenesis protein CcmH [Bryobacteraceae bacterium]